MEKKELEAYYDWFMSIMLERIEILANFVKSTPTFADWEPNYTVDSLTKLGEWFSTQVQTRSRTNTEKEEIYERGPKWFKSVKISNTELNNQTFSLAIDIGMYLSQVFIKNNPTIHWHHQIKGNKNYVDYGQPVLAGFGRLFFNPVQIMLTLAYGLADKTYDESRLKKIYDTWLEYIQ